MDLISDSGFADRMLRGSTRQSKKDFVNAVKGTFEHLLRGAIVKEMECVVENLNGTPCRIRDRFPAVFPKLVVWLCKRMISTTKPSWYSLAVPNIPKLRELSSIGSCIVWLDSWLWAGVGSGIDISGARRPRDRVRWDIFAD